jgi:hypothetical protein
VLFEFREFFEVRRELSFEKMLDVPEGGIPSVVKCCSTPGATESLVLAGDHHCFAAILAAFVFWFYLGRARLGVNDNGLWIAADLSYF